MIATSTPTRQERKRLEDVARFLNRRGAHLAAAVTRLGSPCFTGSTGTAGIRPHGRDIELVFNRSFFNELRDVELAAVLLHEALHFIYRHIPRDRQLRRQTDRQLFRLACEAVINDAIRLNHPDLVLPANPVTGPVLVGRDTAALSADQVAALLRDRLEKEPAFRIAIAAMAETDDHDAWIIDDADGGDDWDESTDELANSILGRFGRTDSIGCGAARQVMHRTVRHDLRQYLNAYLRPPSRWRADWSRPNRKASALFPRVILPTMEMDRTHLEILMAIDASGSVGAGTLSIFTSLAGKPLPGSRVTFISFDTRARLFEHGAEQIMGGGGTRVQAVEEFIHQHMKRYPDIVFVFTDGFTPAPEPDCPERWIWILPPDGTTKAIPGKSRFKYFKE